VTPARAHGDADRSTGCHEIKLPLGAVHRATSPSRQPGKGPRARPESDPEPRLVSWQAHGGTNPTPAVDASHGLRPAARVDDEQLQEWRAQRQSRSTAPESDGGHGVHLSPAPAEARGHAPSPLRPRVRPATAHKVALVHHAVVPPPSRKIARTATSQRCRSRAPEAELWNRAVPLPPTEVKPQPSLASQRRRIRSPGVRRQAAV
jgi:hypothetical protein